LNWAESAPLTLGVEEELMILDAGTLELAPRVDVFLGRDGFKTELFATMLELNTPVLRTPEEVGEALGRLRSTAAEIAEANGLRIAASGSHPISDPEEQEIVDEPRYRAFVDFAGVSARRQGVHGLHVHVGMPDLASCLRVMEGALPWLPAVLAISANSPYLSGRATGHMSNRAEILAQLPRHGAPPPDWPAAVEKMVELGIVKDSNDLWWDVRPSPKFGTLEFRVADQPTGLERTVAFVALIQSLCRRLLDSADNRPADRTLYEEARWTAAHYGPRARLPHPDGTRLATVPELLDELGWPFEGDRCEGDRQLELGVEAAAADLVERTLRFAA
jgi:glutamate---cysteine ligase / carboxylate-amine ligase